MSDETGRYSLSDLSTGHRQSPVTTKRRFAIFLFLAVWTVAFAAAASSFDELRAKAEAGDGKAQWKVAWAYHMGHGVARDESLAAEWSRRASESLRKTAEQGDADAQAILGDVYCRGLGDYAEGLKWLRSASEKDNLQAIQLLSEIYDGGRGGIPPNATEAARLRTKAITILRGAAENGDSDAMLGLARVYAYGIGLPKNQVESLKWRHQAGDHGNVTAQKELGEMYFRGKEVPRDMAEAVRWYRKAADQYREAAEEGDAEAQYHYGQVWEKIAKAWFKTQEQFQHSLENRDAARWYLKAARQGHSGAQFALGCLYVLGNGVEPNDVEGMAWKFVALSCETNEMMRQIVVDALQEDELDIGPEQTRLAKFRSKEMLTEIDANRPKQTGIASANGATGVSDSPKASGSGTIVSTHGHVLTAAHVVAGAKKISVITSSGEHPAAVLRIDESNDLAVLKIEGDNFTPLPIGPSRRARLGQAVATIGFPNVEIQGFSPKVTRGEISSINGAADDPRMWQVSVPVQSGNSGGPLLDEDGNLIGIVVSKLGLGAARVTGDIPQNVNFAVKSAYALPLLEPYLDDSAPEPVQSTKKPAFEDMVSKAQKSVVLVLAY